MNVLRITRNANILVIKKFKFMKLQN